MVFQVFKMNKNGSSDPLLALKPFFLLSLCLLLLTFTVQAAEPEVSPSVKRTLLSSVAPSQEFEVELQVLGFETGGIIETLPEGFSYLGSSLPETQVKLEGQKLIFALLEDKKISYKLKAPASGTGFFSGKWEAVLSEEKGEVQGDLKVSVLASKAGGLGQKTASEKSELDSKSASSASEKHEDKKKTAFEKQGAASKSASENKSENKSGKLPFAGPVLLGGALGFAILFRKKERKGGIL